MKKEKYIIKYEIYFKDGSKILDKEIKVSNCMSEIHSQIKLEKFLINKYLDFKQLIVISCKKDFMNLFGDIFENKNFNDIFGKI